MKTDKQIHHENSKIISSICDFFTLYNSDPERCYKINHFFDLFLSGAVNPQRTDVVRDIVAESWIRSKSYGLSPEIPVETRKIASSAYKKILKDNRSLIEASTPVLEQSLSFLKQDSYCGFAIIDQQGILLHGYNPFVVCELGTDLSEQSVGTTSHSLCLQSGNPAYLISSEHYNNNLRISHATSVPIHDPENKAIAVLSFATRYDNAPIKNRNFIQCLIALQFTIAKRIEDNLRSISLNSQFKPVRNPLDLSTSKSPMIKTSFHTPAPTTIDSILGESSEMLKAKKLTRKFASNPNTILLAGESGTGKELFAQAIHNESRPDGPFIAVNCSSIPKNLVESELFGYERGSFTGAERSGRIGKVELAHNGTLFLDEIGDMPLDVQPVLLRVLEERQVTRVGGNHPIPVNFRVIAATNKDLLEAVKNRAFREDLYFRLAVFKILIPPLRDREDDILSLAKRFIQNECDYLGIPCLKIDPYVTELFKRYNWPGNVRQLKNTILHAVNVAENGIIKISDLPEEMADSLYSSNRINRPRPMADLEKEAITNAMLYTKNNIQHAAEVLEISRSTLYRRLREFGMDC